MPFERTPASRQRPPQGPPGFPLGFQQGGPPTASSNTPPSGSPPKFIPSEAQATTFGAGPGGDVSAFAIDTGAIFPCRFRFTYI